MVDGMTVKARATVLEEKVKAEKRNFLCKNYCGACPAACSVKREISDG